MGMEQQLSAMRLGCETSGVDWSDEECRSEYQRDFDRIAFSREFRRMQGKTQLFPDPNDERVHNRLTHSVEASCVGRYLGAKAAISIGFPQWSHEFAAIVAAAALAHDIGNPPFGHSGERAIQDFFRSNESGQRLVRRLPTEQRRDFTEFDGNQMALRMLSHSLPEKTRAGGGKRLTYSTLAANVKYPCTNKKRRHSRYKKAGIFQSDLEAFARIATHLGLTDLGDQCWSRHALSFLVEAADDIVYAMADVEDGFKRGLVEIDFMEEIFLRIALHVFNKRALSAGLKKINEAEEKVGFLRAKAMNALIALATDRFGANYESILDGSFDGDLVGDCAAHAELGILREMCAEKVYSHRSVVEVEAAGFTVLPALLDTYMNCVVVGPHDEKSKKVVQTLPWHTANAPEGSSEYERLMRVLVYVVGMTDHYAIRAYRVLLGTHLYDS
jgi:dGTPase